MDTNLDAAHGRVYFSLDSQFPDPLEGLPANTGTAAINGFVGGDVLQTIPGVAGPFPYALAGMLGLDLQGPDTDDLDALALWDTNVIGEFEPNIDQILFSVRRGSAVIGAPDSRFGFPIEPGDVLSLPAESLGLAARGFLGGQFGSDELDALDVLAIPTPSTLAITSLALLGLLRRRPRNTR
ncbi:MAG: hypothetical protein ACYTGQ_05925 [Planctomycetota bacterium]